MAPEPIALRLTRRMALRLLAGAAATPIHAAGAAPLLARRIPSSEPRITCGPTMPCSTSAIMSPARTLSVTAP